MLQATYKLLYLGSPLFLTAVFQGLCLKYNWFACLKKPMDMGLYIHGKRVLGDHKTWRGASISIVSCLIGAIVQIVLQKAGSIPLWLPLLDYNRYGILAGLLLGVGITFGELPNSFLKRRMGIAPGMKGKHALRILFFLFDQVDLTLGIWMFLFLLIRPPLGLVAYSFLLTLILHISVSAVGYLLRMRETIV